MSLSGEREEGTTASKMSLSGERKEGTTISKVNQDTSSESVQKPRAESPTTNLLSMKSDQPPAFSQEPLPDDNNEVESLDSEDVLKITHNLLDRRSQTLLTVQQDIKAKLKHKYQHISEGIGHHGNQSLFKDIYTELYITEGGSGGLNNEHEVRQMEMASKKLTTQETPIKCNDIFNPLPGQDKPIRTVLTKGIAGIGKTVSVQKVILDWAEGKANQDVHFMFPLPFRDLNLKKDQYSLMQLLSHYFSELKEIDSIEDGETKTVFIFDGLDECRLPLDFKNNEKCCDVTKPTSVDVLLINLIKRNLLPSALLWVTSRPAAANQIPPECVDQVTEVRGFNDPQKEEYFRKKITDQNLANEIIKHMKTSRILHIMCHMPVFCWISATVLEMILKEAWKDDVPKTLTQMYSHFILIQIIVKNRKYNKATETNPKELSQSDKEMILKLAKLAFQQLQKGNLIFYEEDLRDCGLDVTEASEYSALCTEIFKEESGLYQDKVYSFVHLSIQEFLAAVHALESCLDKKENVFSPTSDDEEKESIIKAVTSDDEEKESIIKAVTSYDEERESIRNAVTSYDEERESIRKTVTSYDEERESIRKTVTSYDEERESIRNAVTSDDEEKSIRKSVTSYDHDDYCDYGDDDYNHDEDEKDDEEESIQLSDLHRRAVDQALKSENGHLDLFLRFLLGLSLESNQNLLRGLLTQTGSTTQTNEETVERTVRYLSDNIERESSPERIINLFHCLNELGANSLVEDMQTSLRSGTLSETRLKPDQCSALAYLLLMSEEVLEEFDLKTYNTSEKGYQRLLPVVKTCKRALLDRCKLTYKSGETLASALQTPNSPLRELDLSDNDLGDRGVELLCVGLTSPLCNIQTLVLVDCKITYKSCETLASALQTPNSPLRELDLSYNDLEDRGVKLLCVGLTSPLCNIQRLVLAGCKLTYESCETLASALQTPNSPLRELDLSNNDLEDRGVELLCVGLTSPLCNIERLVLDHCDLTYESCETLASALQTPNSPLRELDLSHNNDLGDRGVELLCDGLTSPLCNIQTLVLGHCGLTEGCCSALASVLSSPNSQLKQLELRDNDLQDSGVTRLSAGLKDPDCKLHTLGLGQCGLTEGCCSDLASVLSSPNSQLNQLELKSNDLQDSGVTLLSAGLEDPDCKLHTLGLGQCGLTEGCCSDLASVLSSPNSQLKHLELRDNDLQDSGVTRLSAGLEDPDCKLHTLGLSGCLVTEEGCAALSSALRSNPSHLKELDLSYNHPGDSAGELLSAALVDPTYKLMKLNVDHGGECRLKSGPRKYACHLTLDPSTANPDLILSEGNRKVTPVVEEQQHYEDHPDRFDRYRQVLCREGLSDSRYYWEVDWDGGGPAIGVVYKGMLGRAGICIGLTSNSWCMYCSDSVYDFYNAGVRSRSILGPVSSRVGVYLDWPAGTLSFYSVSSSGTLTHLYTFYTTFTEPLYPGFGFLLLKTSSVTLYQINDIQRDHGGESWIKPGPEDTRDHGGECWIKPGPEDTRDHGGESCIKPGPEKWIPQSCKTCDHVEDSTHWLQIEPLTSTVQGVTMFRHRTPKGSYECTVSGLRWLCERDVILKYHFRNWEPYSQLLKDMQYTQGGPLLDITMELGELEEVHLPHFVCLGTNPSLRNEMKILHVEEHGVSLEEVHEVTRFHVKILHPKFSAISLILSYIFSWNVDVHCELMLYLTVKRETLISRLYLFPWNPGQIQAVELQEKSQGSSRILISRPEQSFKLKSSFRLSIPCSTAINPQIHLIQRDTTPSFFRAVVKMTGIDIEMELFSDDERTVWKEKVSRDEYISDTRSTSAVLGAGRPAESSLTGSAEQQLRSVRTEFVKRASRAVLDGLLDGLLQHTVINQQEMESVKVIAERAEKARDIIDMVLRKGTESCSRMINLLGELDHCLCSQLQINSVGVPT